jgi:hypothetical protein
MTTFLLWITTAAAGWTQTGADNGCTWFTGAAEGTITPLRAECDWSIPASKLQTLLADFNMHDDYFSAVSQSVVIGAGMCRQVHVASGISDREVVIAFKTEDIPGGKRYSWQKASDQSAVTGAGVMPGTDTGKWEVTTNATGGSHVVYELHYDPSGSVPSFVIRWFQGSGFKAFVLELKSWAESH